MRICLEKQLPKKRKFKMRNSLWKIIRAKVITKTGSKKAIWSKHQHKDNLFQ